MVESCYPWFTKSDPGVSFYQVRYEDLVLNAYHQLYLIFDFLGYSINHDSIRRCISNSNMSSMKHLETPQGYACRPVSNDLTFVDSKSDPSYNFRIMVSSISLTPHFMHAH